MDLHSECLNASSVFVSPGSDYYFIEGSFAEDGGTALAEVTDDLEGNDRPLGSAYDIGAYEHFCENGPVMIQGVGCYNSLRSAYEAAGDGDSILCRDHLRLVNDAGVRFDLVPGKTFTLASGYGCDFSGSPTGTTFIGGTVEIATGGVALLGGRFTITGD